LPDSSPAARPRPGAGDLAALVDRYAAARVTAAGLHELTGALVGPDRDAVEADASRAEQDAVARHAELMSALDNLTRTTLQGVPDRHLPVCTWRKGIVEIRAVLPDGSRAVRVKCTPAEAIAVGAALIACGAVADTTTGGTLGPILPPFPTGTDQAAPTADDTGRPVVEHDCQASGTLVYVAAYGAPGVGQAWSCTDCGRGWARVGGLFYPAEENVHILSPEDCI
jgi:hypothetical protein